MHNPIQSNPIQSNPIQSNPIQFPWNEWAKNVEWKSFLQLLFATGISGSDTLNPPIWTLVMELRIAVIFPALVWYVRKFGVFAVIGSVGAGFLASKAYAVIEPNSNMYTHETILGGALLTVYYMMFFVFGVFIAARLDILKNLMLKIPTKVHIFAGILFFLIPISALPVPYSLGQLLLAGLSSYLILCCISFARFEKFLLLRPFQWLGKVSYSLYLTHIPIIFSLTYLLYDYLSLPYILTVAVSMAFVIAHLSQKYIEQPSISFGKKLAP